MTLSWTIQRDSSLHLSIVCSYSHSLCTHTLLLWKCTTRCVSQYMLCVRLSVCLCVHLSVCLCACVFVCACLQQHACIYSDPEILPLQIAVEHIRTRGEINCSAFLEFKGQLYCSVEDVLSDLYLSDSDDATPLYEFDHAYRRPDIRLPTVILYAEIGTEMFVSMHITMATLASDGRVNYILRHYEAVRM